MTSVDGGTHCYQTETPFVAAPSHPFISAEGMKNSEEVDDRLDEALSTDSPKSKDSWPKSTTNDVDVSPLKNNYDDYKTVPQAQHTRTVMSESHISRGTGVYGEEEMDVRREEGRDKFQPGAETVVSEFPKEISSSPLCSTDSATAMESMDLHELSPLAQKKTEKEMEAEQHGGEVELSDDDDFGEFEEAEDNFKILNEKQKEADDDEFGDFEEVASPVPPNGEAESFLEALPEGQSTAVGDSMLKLTGRDYTTAAASTLSCISFAKRPLTCPSDISMVLRAARVNSCCESRLGIQLLYPRHIPAGFLRSSGAPVLVSSKTVAAEQTFLTKLGLYSMYKNAQFPNTGTEQDTPAGSSRSPSRTETRSKNSLSEIQSANDDLNFDLDFLVQFSSQQLTAGSVSSNKTGIESSFHEDMKQHSHLHDLFDGVVRSSQSSFVSRSSELSDQTPERSQNSLSGFPSQPHGPEPSLDEREWGMFMKNHQEPAYTQKTVQGLRNDEAQTDEWKDFTAAADMVVEPSNNQNLVQDNTEDDIFSGEWLDQLRSSHEHPEAAPVHDVPLSGEASGADFPAESEWGTFTAAPHSQAECHHEFDPLHGLMPGPPEIEQLHASHGPSINASRRSADRSPHSAAPKGFNPNALDLLIMLNSTESKKSNPSCSLLAMEESFLMGSSGTGDGGHQSEDEWGLFQG